MAYAPFLDVAHTITAAAAQNAAHPQNSQTATAAQNVIVTIAVFICFYLSFFFFRLH